MSKFQAAPIFTDYMVLQRGKNITIFGTGEEGVEVLGELGGFRAACVIKDGKWKLTFPPMGAARYMRLKLMDGEEEEVVRYDNVAIGEVWLISGEMASDFSADSDEKLPETGGDAANDVRYYNAGGERGWNTLTEQVNAACTHFALELSRYHDVTVGIIAADKQSAPNAAPYTLNGALYYRYESNEVEPEKFFENLLQNIIGLRTMWNNDQLPFIIGQLPLKNNISETASIVREGQFRAYRNLNNTGIAVMLDLSDKDHETIGKRFAAQALHIVYGGYDGACSPSIKNAVWRGDMVELHFDNALGGFKTNGEPDGFEICGSDGIYVPAFVDISGERIFLSSDDIAHPCGVRYLWNRGTDDFMRNGFGLPMVPFRLNIN